ncbi:MAG: hypothetical protein FJZ58_04735 [Chlamydiae bacterium]|nr:hypothetical protein [Chlamydiota bacterium]
MDEEDLREYACKREEVRKEALAKAHEQQVLGLLMLPEEVYVEQEINRAIREWEKHLVEDKERIEKALYLLAKEMEFLPSLEKEEIQIQFARAKQTFEKGTHNDLWEGKSSLQEVCHIHNEVLLWIYQVGYQRVLRYHYEEAEALFLLLTVFNPFVCDYWLALGLVQKELKKKEEALHSLHIAQRLQPEDAEIYLHQAKLWLELGECAKAGYLLEQALQENIESKELEEEILRLQRQLYAEIRHKRVS